MARIAYVNGRYVPHGQAMVHVEDRGYQFADGVYEVIAVHKGRLVDREGHLDRLERSLAELGIDRPMARGPLGLVIEQVRRRNRLADGLVYIQVTRGVAPRDHAIPSGVRPSLVVTAKRKVFDPETALKGVAVITLPDNRWKRCDIKSISLLANVMNKEMARQAGAFEAWMVDETGSVTEGAASNAWIVTEDGVLVTRPLGPSILGGITRQAVLDLADHVGIGFEERPFSVGEARRAREAFLTSSTSYVRPVVLLDGEPVGDGRAGPAAKHLLEIYLARLEAL